MKRDKKLAVDILREIRNSPGWRDRAVLSKLNVGQPELDYHIKMLTGAGFIAVHEDGKSLALTWSGHEELDRRETPAG